MDITEDRPAFTGRGQKPSNKEVLKAIASIKKCRQRSFFKPSEVSRQCYCGWYTKATARRKKRSLVSATTSSSTSNSPPSLYRYVNVASCSNSFYVVLLYAHRLDLDRCRPVDQCPVKHQPPLPSLYMYVNVASCCNSFYDVILRPQTGSGPVHPIFDKSAFQTPTIGELRALGIRTKTAPGKLDLLVYCPLKGRCPHCIFMTHDSSYVDTLPTTEQIKREFVSCKGNGSHISLRQLLRSELTVAQVERYIEDEVQEHYLQMKAKYIEL